MKTFDRRRAAMTAVLAATVFVFGCGIIADPSRVKIAKIGDEVITRGDFAAYLRGLSDEERPVIQTKGDLNQAVKRYMDDRVKRELVAALEANGNLDVPRQEAENLLRAQRPGLFHDTEEMRAEGISWADLDQAMRLEFEAARESMIDRVHMQLLGNRAVAYRAQEAMKNNTVTITDEEFEQEYALRKDELKVLERVRFAALRFPVFIQGAESMAADARRRIDAGENFYAVAGEYKAQNPQFFIESEIENNPAVQRFAGLWESLAGCEKGDVIGPVFLPPAEGIVGEGAGGAQQMPAAFLVLKVLEHWPERSRTFEEAKSLLASQIVFRKVMNQLREEYGVEIYEENIPDPSFLEVAL